MSTKKKKGSRGRSPRFPAGTPALCHRSGGSHSMRTESNTRMANRGYESGAHGEMSGAAVQFTSGRCAASGDSAVGGAGHLTVSSGRGVVHGRFEIGQELVGDLQVDG